MTAPATPDLDSTLHQTFDVLEELVSAAFHDGRVVYAASLKSQLVRRFPGFTERAYGFSKFLDYIEAAQSAGKVEVIRDDAGHPKVYPVGQLPSPKSLQTPTTRRVKPDLWTAMVNWDEPAARYWDRKSRRAILLPLDETGRPRWETERDGFVAIDPISMATHLEWMRTFADARDAGEAKDALLEALAPDARPGEFKRALEAYGLTTEWSICLRTEVTAHTRAWAQRASVPLASVMATQRSEPSPSAQGQGIAGHTDTRTEEPSLRPEPTDVSLEDSLRVRLHAVIDKMSLNELAALTVPAAYLINE